MSKVIVNVANVQQQLALQGVEKFVCDESNIVGLKQKSDGTVELTYKVAESAVPTTIVVDNDFQELVDLMLFENPNRFVAEILPTYVASGVDFVSHDFGGGVLVLVPAVVFEKQKNATERFVCDVTRLKGIALVNGATEITLSTGPNSIPSKVKITNDFDEVADLFINGPFDPESD